MANPLSALGMWLTRWSRMIEAHSLYNSGIGLTDVHLLASSLITPFTLLWTRDERLRRVAEGLGICANLP